MSENQIRAGGIALELANTKKNLMEALNQNADLQKQVEELERQLKTSEKHCEIKLKTLHKRDVLAMEELASQADESDQRIKELENLDNLVICPDCGAIDRAGNWPLADADSDDGKVTCLGCGEDVKPVTSVVLVERIKELETKNAEYLVDVMALKCVSSQMHCAFCNHEMIDANPGDGGVYIRKLVIEHMDKCEKHPLFEARKRIKELEAEVAGLKSVMMEIGSDCDCLSCGGQKLHDKLCVVGKIEQAISTPTGQTLLEKVIAAEVLIPQAYELSTWAAAINWNGGKNAKEWLKDLRSKIEVVQNLYYGWKKACEYEVKE